MTKRKRDAGSRGYQPRQVGTIDLRQRFLIVCEGEKTEPNYFYGFRVYKIIKVCGLGYNTVSLVKEAMKLSQENDYDQVWCVFDRDSFSVEQFNEAIELASNNNIKVAYSNEAFELWYLLHFNYYDTAISRNEYCTKLSKLLQREYKKNDDNMYRELEPLQSTAIQNASTLLKQYDPLIPAKANPSTTVHLLVEALLSSAC